MAIGVIVECSGATQRQYDAVMKELNWGSKLPPIGIVSHVAGPMEGGWLVVDVWESQAAFDRFVNERLGKAMEHAAMPQPRIRSFPVHNILTERSKAVGQ